MLKRNTTITPAFDYILNDKENAKYGRGCASIIFEVNGDKGAVTLSAFTNWYLPETIKAINNINKRNVSSRILAIHSKEKLNEDSEAMLIDVRDNCCYTGGICYCYNVYGCSYEQELISLMVREGSEKLFEKLEEIYKKFLQ